MYMSSKMPGHLIRRLHQYSTQVFLQRAREAGFDLTPVQFAALDALRDRPGTDQAGLAEAIGKDRATIGAVVDRLEQKNLLKRDVSTSDRRARVLSLTDRGETLLSEVLPLVERLQKEILPGLDDAEYEQFIALAAKAAAAARALDEQ
ncbi:MarR family winged helix-turn-helix transcriptional regulator [Pelagibacterium halotolerans]|uniref:Transcriptional regulator, MarR family n=1 Tax=Pelagibacterium halotolerans (strain DSM 22347 / JCM 15775 / CGMCC 1.7692 / B2) TaxID=1082931 RepID=G4RGQ3_PELHB|nr:MarR family transcriptional regulator [Pelagibacterium halotolerans]AEQ52092.1 transcriptional regulator, MarR family [Pelagibacterium halotolerans B2]SDZ83295.1 transcriptional regulator, MarR family [Pelagibacterium halotolerans]